MFNSNVGATFGYRQFDFDWDDDDFEFDDARLAGLFVGGVVRF